MKKYRRRTPLVSPAKVAMVAVYAIIAMVLIWWLSGDENEWTIICGAIFTVILVFWLFLVLAVGHGYVYCNTAIELYYFKIKYRKIKYTEFSYICISNASYNNGYGYGIYGNIPMRYKCKAGGKARTYPFITIHKWDYPVQSIKKAMTSRDLFILDRKNTFCLGICWFDSLLELLDHTNISVYVLEDVYLRFREKFDAIFIRYGMDNQLYIVTEQGIEHMK